MIYKSREDYVLNEAKIYNEYESVIVEFNFLHEWNLNLIGDEIAEDKYPELASEIQDLADENIEEQVSEHDLIADFFFSDFKTFIDKETKKAYLIYNIDTYEEQ